MPGGGSEQRIGNGSCWMEFSDAAFEAEYSGAQFAASMHGVVIFHLVVLVSQLPTCFAGHGLIPVMCCAVYALRIMFRLAAYFDPDLERGRLLFGRSVVATTMVNTAFGIVGVNAGLPGRIGMSLFRATWLALAIAVRQIFMRLGRCLPFQVAHSEKQMPSPVGWQCFCEC